LKVRILLGVGLFKFEIFTFFNLYCLKKFKILFEIIWDPPHNYLIEITIGDLEAMMPMNHSWILVYLQWTPI
jgi:hypothetical protein